MERDYMPKDTLKEWIGKQVKVLMRDTREYYGKLLSIDEFYSNFFFIKKTYTQF